MERKTESIYTLTPCFDGYLEETLDGEIRLADYYPDAQEILKTDVTAQIISKKTLGDKIHVDGSGVFRVYYSSSDGSRLGSVSLQIPFSKVFDTKTRLPADAKIDATAAVQYKNTRLVNSRKLEVKASIGISVKAKAKQANEYLIPTNGDCEYETYSVSVGDFIGFNLREQRISEEFALPDGKPAIGVILRSNAYARITDIKAITNKAVIKGDVILSLLYLDENSNPEKLEYSLPVAQIVEVEGICETSNLRAVLNVPEYKTEPITSNGGESVSVRFDALVLAELEGYDKKQIDICTDSYSVIYSTQIKTGEIVATELTEVLNLNKAFRETLEYPGDAVKSIYDIWGSLGAVDCQKEGDVWNVNSTVCLTVLAIDNENRLCSVDSEIPVTAEIHTRPQQNCTVTADAILTSLSFTLTGENLIEVRGETAVNAAVYKHSSITAVTDIAFSDTAKKNKALPFSVYFATAGEKLWDIAKNHNSAVSSIKQHNDIESDVIDCNRTLKIFS